MASQFPEEQDKHEQKCHCKQLSSRHGRKTRNPSAEGLSVSSELHAPNRHLHKSRAYPVHHPLDIVQHDSDGSYRHDTNGLYDSLPRSSEPRRRTE